MKISSAAFSEGDFIPKKYTCDGENISPPLNWSGHPEQCRSLALIFEDPDAPSKTWIHWVLYQIPPAKSSLKEGLPARIELEEGMKQGTNDFRKAGYGGPCPPGGTHRYYMKLYALDTEANFKPGLTARELMEKIEAHIIEKAELMGRYHRS